VRPIRSRTSLRPPSESHARFQAQQSSAAQGSTTPPARSLESCRASTSRFPDWKNGNAFQRTEVGIRCSVQASHSTHGKRLTLKGSASRVPKHVGFPRLRNLLICSGMASRNSFLGITLPSCHCRICGSVPVLWHTKRRVGHERTFGITLSESTVRLGYAGWGAIRSLQILYLRLDRFMTDQSLQKAPRACSPCASLRGSDLKVPDRSAARRSLPRETCPPSCDSCLFSALPQARVTRRRLAGHRATQRRD